MKKYFAVCLLILLPPLLFAEGGRSIDVLFDVSRSIPPKDFEKARKAVSELMKQSESSDEISLYVFGDGFKKVGPVDLQQMEPTQSRTMLYDSVYDVAQTLAASSAGRKAILIVSDGVDTSSATVLEDAVGYANAHGIVIYGIGVGKVDRRSLERIAKLTGGKFFNIQNPNFVSQLNQSISAQNSTVVQKPAAPIQAASAATPAAPASRAPSAPAVPVPTTAGKGGIPFLWIAGIFGGALLLLAVGLVVFRSLRGEVRTCPECGRKLGPQETTCGVCSAADTNPMKKFASAAPTQELAAPIESEIEELIPRELLEKKPVTEEDLSKTFVLMETPMLVVRKGKSLGQSYSLHRAFPVSIGRSKVNEILLDDVAVSGQHCRIIPENGKHVLYDLGSTNGTFVNDRKVHKAILKEGDTIKIGETQFVFRIEQHRN